MNGEKVGECSTLLYNCDPMKKYRQFPQQSWFPMAVFTLIALCLSLFTPKQPQNRVQAASKSIRPSYELFQAPYSEGMAWDLFTADSDVQNQLEQVEHDFIQAVPLAHGEASRWAEEGCWDDVCAHVLLYNYTDGGTIEGVVNLARETVLDVWENESNRPLASQRTLGTAVQIASLDPEVREVLGKVTAADITMVPMNIWLLDDGCNNAWCVDLTFHDPAETGKIFHVTVNLEEKKVARTFYTRGRPEIPYRDITPQRDAFSDGCHEANGWEVCWEMTAHDGLEFFDAKFEGTTIFSSAKIGQVEVWYPSWPGGYRDEIGHSASVPPYFDTTVTEIEHDGEDGFKVSQLFTEFTRWPNCICCYRYDQTMAFYEDGTFEARFVSHGPGCDDLSIYQPMWRIDLDLDGRLGDEIWTWDTNQWVEMTEETELELIADNNVSPDGEKFAIFDGDLHYRWSYIGEDPLGLDEAKGFFLRQNEGEGDNPILTGAANTFQPPRQWIDGETLSGRNVVLWYVPLLKTKKGGPWYCMPEPAEEFTPCEAILRASPGGELPTAEELAAILPTATPTIEVDPNASPTPTLIPTMTSTPPPSSFFDGDDAETLILNAGCAACHVIGEIGDHGKVGPDLTNFWETAVARGEELGMTPQDYTRQSLLDPNAYIVESCPNDACLANIMPDYYGERLNAAQLETIIDYLLADGAGAGLQEIGTDNTATPEMAATPVISATPETATGEQSTGWFLGGLFAGALGAGGVVWWLRRKQDGADEDGEDGEEG